MPIELTWLDERQSILVWRFSGDWTIEDFGEFYIKSLEMCGSVDHWVNSIVIDQDSDKLFNLISATRTQRERPDPRNYDMAALVLTKSLYSRMLEIMSESPMQWGKIKVFYEYADALAFVEARQKELAAIPVLETGQQTTPRRPST